jgi:kynureninase
MTDFAWTKTQFHLPEGMIYLDGNSLGPLPVSATDRVMDMMRDQWGDMLITGWNKAGWMAQSKTLGDRIGRLIGAEPNHITVGDTLSIKVYQALASALALRPDRRVIVSDNGNFPSDLYMAQGLIKSLGADHELRIVNPEDVHDAITEDVAVTLITEVDYRTGRRHDMARLTKRAHDMGALTIWDLAHSAGAVDVDLAGVGADFAVGCTYKYLNGGPGAPAFIYVRPSLVDHVEPALSGWLGHVAPFDFDLEYQSGHGIDRMRVGTPPVIANASLGSALDIWDHVTMSDVRTRSMDLTQRFIDGIEASCPMLTLASPRDPAQRGSQVSFRFAEGYAAMQACIAAGVIGDFRAPDIMRFGFTPLFIDADDVAHAVQRIAHVMTHKLWDAPEYKNRNAVT